MRRDDTTDRLPNRIDSNPKEYRLWQSVQIVDERTLCRNQESRCPLTSGPNLFQGFKPVSPDDILE